MNQASLRSNIAQNTSSARIYNSGNGGPEWNLGRVFSTTIPRINGDHKDVRVQRAIVGPDAWCAAGSSPDYKPRISCASHYMAWGAGILQHIKRLREEIPATAPIVQRMEVDSILNLAGSLYETARYHDEQAVPGSDLDTRMTDITFWRLMEFSRPDWVMTQMWNLQNKEEISGRVEGINWSLISRARSDSNDELAYAYDPAEQFKDTAFQLGIRSSRVTSTMRDHLGSVPIEQTAAAFDLARALRMDPLLRHCASSWDDNKLLGFVLEMRNRAAQRPLIGPDRDSETLIRGWQEYIAQEICDRSDIPRKPDIWK